MPVIAPANATGSGIDVLLLLLLLEMGALGESLERAGNSDALDSELAFFAASFWNEGREGKEGKKSNFLRGDLAGGVTSEAGIEEEGTAATSEEAMELAGKLF